MQNAEQPDIAQLGKLLETRLAGLLIQQTHYAQSGRQLQPENLVLLLQQAHVNQHAAEQFATDCLVFPERTQGTSDGRHRGSFA